MSYVNISHAFLVRRKICALFLGLMKTVCTVEPIMSSHPCDTEKLAFKRRLLLIGGTFLYKMPFWGMAK